MKKFYRKKGSKYSIEELARLHERLADKHHELDVKFTKLHGTSSAEHWIKTGYHNAVARRLRELNRRLTEKEKKDLYNSSAYYYYN